jgi:hypothetical protein
MQKEFNLIRRAMKRTYNVPFTFIASIEAAKCFQSITRKKPAEKINEAKLRSENRYRKIGGRL